MADETELHDKLIRFISARDRVTPEKAKAILNKLSPADLTMTEMQAANVAIRMTRSVRNDEIPHALPRGPSEPLFRGDYDTFARRPGDYNSLAYPDRSYDGNSCLPEHSPQTIIPSNRGWYK
jgi:hypothetical protein